MRWNHRVIAKEYNREILLQIHEVYYDKNEPKWFTQDPIHIIGDDLEELNWTVDKIKECLNKPILWGDDKFPQEYNLD